MLISDWSSDVCSSDLLTFAPSLNNTPVYSLRGIGFNDSGFGSAPAVAVYIDESPLPFPVMTEAAALDLERIEVLKRSEERRVGKEWVSTCRSRWSPYH